MKRLFFTLCAFVAVLLAAGRVEAQTANSPDRQSHWGVLVNFAPTWTVPDTLKPVFDASRVDVKGGDFEIGLVRGRDLGGDWGISLVRKTLKSGSVVERGLAEDVCYGGTCVLLGDRYVARSASLLGVSIHKYVPFVTIARRAQIGMNFAGGVASVRGEAELHSFWPDYSVRLGGVVQGETLSQVPASELIVSGLKTVPLLKLEVAGAAILAPGLKVRVGGGLNFPAAYPAVNVSVAYLFGAR